MSTFGESVRIRQALIELGCPEEGLEVEAGKRIVSRWDILDILPKADAIIAAGFDVVIWGYDDPRFDSGCDAWVTMPKKGNTGAVRWIVNKCEGKEPCEDENLNDFAHDVRAAMAAFRLTHPMEHARKPVFA